MVISCNSDNIKCEALVTRRCDSLHRFLAMHVPYLLFVICIIYVLSVMWSLFIGPYLQLLFSSSPLPVFFLLFGFFRWHFFFYKNFHRFHGSVITVQLVDSLYVATSFIFTHLCRKNNVLK